MTVLDDGSPFATRAGRAAVAAVGGFLLALCVVTLATLPERAARFAAGPFGNAGTGPYTYAGVLLLVLAALVVAAVALAAAIADVRVDREVFACGAVAAGVPLLLSYT